MADPLGDFWRGFSGQTSYRPQENYMEFKKNLQGAAFGQAPSAAQAQLQSGKEQAMAAAASQAASARGNVGQRAAAQRAATFGAAAASQQAANQAAALRAQEQAAARQTMADYIGREQQQMSQIEMANAQGRQKGYGVIGAVGGGILGALSDMRAKQDVTPAVALMDNSHSAIDARRRAEDAAREEAARRQGGTGNAGADLLSMAGGMLMSDRRAKELEAENKGLKDSLLSLVRPGPATAAPREQTPNRGAYFQPEFKDERAMNQEAARYYLENRQAAMAERKAQEQAAVKRAGEGQDDETARKWAEYERQKSIEEADRRSSTMVQPNPKAAWQPYYPEPALSDERSKERIQELEGRLGLASETPTGRLPDLPIVAPSPDQSRADLGPLKPYVSRYKDWAAEQQGTDAEPRLNIMAQDALKSPSYQSAVIERPDGMLGLDRDRMLQANTAELAGVDKRLRELEQIKQDALGNIRKARR